jgi:hypothetical protein
MTAARIRLPTLAILCALCACRSGPALIDVPEHVHVAVEINGRESETITTTALRAAPPDFYDVDHRAWRLATLLEGRALQPGMLLEVEQTNGTRTTFAQLAQPGEGNEPVLMVNRKGQVLIALVAPDNPFPAFHGRGGNRGKGGAANRIRDVTKLRLTSP